MIEIDKDGFITSNFNINNDLTNKINIYNDISNNKNFEKKFIDYLAIIEEVNKIELEIYKKKDSLQSE